MLRGVLVCTAAILAAALGAAAQTYPLTFKVVTADQMGQLPGGYGTYGSLQFAKPAGLKKEPRPVSRNALYGETRGDQSTPRYVYRLDESKGEGKGYDQLIVDMNQNGDLTDDSVVMREVPLANERSQALKPVWFGPIPGPAGKKFAGGHPVFFAQMYLRLPVGRPANARNVFAGYLRFKAGWYLEAEVDAGGVKQKVALYDGNNNLRVGDSAESQTYQSSGDRNWYFRPADVFFVDANGSGAFENDRLESESRPFAPILYLGQKPYKVSLAADCASLRLEPWTDALAEVAVEPHGGQVRKLVVAWEHPAGRWQLLNPVVEDGRIQVPPGRYRLYYCALYGQNSGADPVMVSGNQRVPKTPLKFEAGRANTLRCGGPLEVAATAQKRTPQNWEISPGGRFDARTDSNYIVRINANFRGADGEIYSTFATGPKLADKPPKPVFRVVGADGKQLAKGNLEFG